MTQSERMHTIKELKQKESEKDMNNTVAIQLPSAIEEGVHSDNDKIVVETKDLTEIEIPPTPKSTTTAKTEITTPSSSLSARDNLRHHVAKKRSSLTLPEASFLEFVAECGNDDEIETAKNKLMDDTLFFESRDASTTKHVDDNTAVSGMTARTSEESTTVATTHSCPANLSGIRDDNENNSQLQQEEGSVRRNQRLEHRRRTSATHIGMWKARESGMNLSTRASRTSLVLAACSNKLLNYDKIPDGDDTRPAEVELNSQGWISACSSMRDSITSVDDSVLSSNNNSACDLGYNNNSKRRAYRRQSSSESADASFMSPATTGGRGRRSSLRGSFRGANNAMSSSLRGSIHSRRRSVCLSKPSMAIAEYGTLSSTGLLDSDFDDSVFDDSDTDVDLEEDDNDRKEEEKKEDEDTLGELKDSNHTLSSFVSSSTSRSSQRYQHLFQGPLKTRRASANIYGGEGFEVGDFETSLASICRQAALEDEFASEFGDDDDDRSIKSEGNDYDPWMVLGNEFDGIQFDFSILGTSAQDESAKPHVLSPPIMESLQAHLPFSKRGESFWLKYSMVRDGSSAITFLEKLRGSSYTILALETLDGEVFGAFTAEPWHITHSYFGTGETFVWKMKHSRSETCHSVVELAQKESEIEVYRNTFENRCMQICKNERLAVGGGSPTTAMPKEIELSPTSPDGGQRMFIQPNEWGFAINFEGDSLLEATSSPCITFNSPSLCNEHSDGSRFELMNVEAWTLTPCISVEQAEVMECSQLFLKRHITV